MPRGHKRPPLPLTQDDYRRLREHLRPHRQLYLDAIVESGLSRAELHNIQVHHCDPRANDMRIIRSDGNHARFVPLPRILRKLSESTPSGPLLAPWYYVNRDLRAACFAAGIEPRNFTDLRETFAAWQRAAGKPEADIARCMGRQPDDEERQDEERDPSPRRPVEPLRA